jgi:aspartate aminotransferase
MNTLSASATVTINAIAKKKKINGEKVYNFAAGDPVLPNHPSITQRVMRETENKFCPYPPVEGIPELRSLAAEWMNTTCHTDYSKENVLVTCGGKFALFALIYSFLQQGEEVLIPAPYWVSYPDIVKMAGGTPRIIPTCAENDWKITGQDLLRHVTPNTKILIFNNACNPTGVLYTKQEISDILAVAAKSGLRVISDEVYSGLVYEEPGFISCGTFPEHRERVLIVQSCSKNFGMTGWRVGFIFAPEDVIKRLAILQSQSTTGTALMSQWAAVGALENAEEVNCYVKETMRQRRDLFVHTFHSLFLCSLPEIKSALYAFVSLASMGMEKTINSVAFCEQLIASHNIALVPGTAFGIDGHARFAFSETEADIREALHVLKKATEKIK